MKGGYVHNCNHFTGKKAHKSKRKNKHRVKEKRVHKNKYEDVSKKEKKMIFKRKKTEVEKPQPNPPKAGTTPSPKDITSHTPPPMSEVKPLKQRTVLSVRDFAILYNIMSYDMARLEAHAEEAARFYINNEDKPVYCREYIIDQEKKKRILEEDLRYQDLLRIREKLGELNIVVETPSVEVEE